MNIYLYYPSQEISCARGTGNFCAKFGFGGTGTEAQGTGTAAQGTGTAAQGTAAQAQGAMYSNAQGN
jgi:hypothetical protein